MKSAKLVLITVAIIAGCAVTDSRRSWQNGVADTQTGKIVALWLQYADKDKAITIEKEYTMIIIWNEREKRFYLFDNSEKQYFGSTDFDAFIAEIDTLPQNITLQQINTCCAPLDWKMPDEASQKLSSVLKKGNRTLDHSVMVCTCESTDRKFLDYTDNHLPLNER
jgi:hypothetical protein